MSAAWTKTATGYRLDGGPIEAALVKVGRSWSLRAGSCDIDLGRRASFDRAEAEVSRIASLNPPTATP